jgi:hypothetical protein
MISLQKLYCANLLFEVFVLGFFEKGFHDVTQASLKLLIHLLSLPSGGMTDMHHQASYVTIY